MENSYKPLPNFLIIKDSSIHGLGVFATVDIKHRIDFAIGNTHFEYSKNDKCNTLLRLPLGAFINHSKNPNVTIRSTLIPYAEDTYKNWKYYGAFTLRDIEAGEEITLDYTKELCGKIYYGDLNWLKYE